LHQPGVRPPASGWEEYSCRPQAGGLKVQTGVKAGGIIVPY
jgi:hypothetical protein